MLIPLSTVRGCAFPTGHREVAILRDAAHQPLRDGVVPLARHHARRAVAPAAIP
jgi:hypothetical protein